MPHPIQHVIQKAGFALAFTSALALNGLILPASAVIFPSAKSAAHKPLTAAAKAPSAAKAKGRKAAAKTGTRKKYIPFDDLSNPPSPDKAIHTPPGGGGG